MHPDKKRCDLDCCIDEYTAHLDEKSAKERTIAKANEQIFEIDEPIKVYLFDIPRGQYLKRAIIASIFTTANFVLGGVCTILCVFPFEDTYAEFSRNIHVPFSILGMIYHVTPGMMAMCKFYDSSHVLKWVDRRKEHALQMAASLLFLFTGLFLFVWKGDPELTTLHAFCGMGTAIAQMTAFVTGFVACMGSKIGERGSRGPQSIMTTVHALIGFITYASCIVTLYSGLKNALELWLISLFGQYICPVLVSLTIYLYLVSLLGPCLRRKANKAKKDFEKRVKRRKKREEKAKKKMIKRSNF